MLHGEWKLEPGPYHNSHFSSLTLSRTPHYLIRVGFRTLLFLKTTNLFLSCCCESTDTGNQLKMIKQCLQPEIIFLTKITTIQHCHIKHFAKQISKLRSEQVNPRRHVPHNSAKHCDICFKLNPPWSHWTSSLNDLFSNRPKGANINSENMGSTPIGIFGFLPSQMDVLGKQFPSKILLQESQEKQHTTSFLSNHLSWWPTRHHNDSWGILILWLGRTTTDLSLGQALQVFKGLMVQRQSDKSKMPLEQSSTTLQILTRKKKSLRYFVFLEVKTFLDLLIHICAHTYAVCFHLLSLHRLKKNGKKS